jgi:uncharacterized membrane protein YoaK (UPF0700 family)
MPFSAERSARSRRAYTTLSLLVAGVAGAVNAMSLFALGQHPSHMTGHITVVGESLAQGNWSQAAMAARLVLAFLVGAVTAAVLLDASRHRHRGRHALALLVETATLGGVGYWLHTHPGVHAPTLLGSIAFAMGLQNALVTRVSGAVVRTTHLTGVLTDIGIQLVRMAVWVRDGARERGLRGLWRKVQELPSAEQFERTRLHAGLAIAFLSGATVGSVLFLHYGAAAMAVPCTMLLLVVALDMSPMGASVPNTLS